MGRRNAVAPDTFWRPLAELERTTVPMRCWAREGVLLRAGVRVEFGEVVGYWNKQELVHTVGDRTYTGGWFPFTHYAGKQKGEAKPCSLTDRKQCYLRMRWHKGGQVDYHRQLAQDLLNDGLLPEASKEYVVHHIDGDSKNNAVGNLVVVTAAWHNWWTNRQRGRKRPGQGASSSAAKKRPASD
jgi:hypothetical protein